MIPDLNKEMKDLINAISRRRTFYGEPMPDSVMKLFRIVETELSIAVEAPFWIYTMQKGRGPRQSNRSHGLTDIIYNWMKRRNLFESVTDEGQRSEARRVTWYMNKYGNKHFRSKKFIDIYTTARMNTIREVINKFGEYVHNITIGII